MRGIHRRLCPAIPRFLLLDDGNHDEGLDWLGPPQPEEGIEQQTGKKDAGQVVQNSLCLASACMAALPSARPILRLARESSGITIPEKLKTVHVSYTAIWGRDSNAVPFPRPQPLLGDAKTLK
jgi:hypothetical protein